MLDRFSEFQRLSKELNRSAACSSSNASNRERKGTDGPPPVPRDLESAILQSAPLLDDFMSAQEGVQGGCERIERFISEIDQLHRTALVTVSPDESHELAKRIEASSVLASAEATTVRRLLKSMDGESKNLGLELSPSDLRLRVSKQRALCKRFMALMERFESMQLLHRNKYRQQMERQFKLVKPEATEAELLELRDSPQAMTQQIFMLANRSQANQSLNVMKERHEEIQKLEKSMSQLHTMFLDISFLVDQQGYTLDRVEEYVDSSREATEQAATVMQSAVIQQRSAQRRRWFMAGIGLTIFIVLVVIIVLALTDRL